jgi:hypothetical protein
MELDRNSHIEPGKEPSEDRFIYFSMNMPDWFVNKPGEEKCKIVEALAAQLKDEKPISEKQRRELFSIN